VQYKLFVKVENEVIQPCRHHVITLNENPAWVSIDQKIIKIGGLPGIRLKPFIQKESLFIPDTHAKEFFEKFVMENLQNVEVIAEGFEHDIHNKITDVSLKVRDAFTENRFVLELVFSYGGASFAYGEPASFRNKISYENDRVSVREFRRDKEGEESFIQQFIRVGFE